MLSKSTMLTAKTPPLRRQHFSVLSMMLGSDFLWPPPLTSLNRSFSLLSMARFLAMFCISLTGLFLFNKSSLSMSLCWSFCSLCWARLLSRKNSSIAPRKLSANPLLKDQMPFRSISKVENRPGIAKLILTLNTHAYVLISLSLSPLPLKHYDFSEKYKSSIILVNAISFTLLYNYILCLIFVINDSLIINLRLNSPRYTESHQPK